MAHIAVIEPDRVLGQVYQLALQDAGYTVHWSQDAQRGIQLINDHSIDIIIVELQMAVHNGIEFLYELRSYAEWQHIPVIILSNVPSSHPNLSPVLWENIGIAAYLYKPLAKLTDIVAAVKQVRVPAA